MARRARKAAPRLGRAPGAPRPGHRIGLDNVRQRLELMFHGEADLEVIETSEHFLVTLRFPVGAMPA